jgi:hypothetical protein
MTTALEFDARLSVSPDSRITVGESTWAPNLRMGTRFFTGRILECPQIIGPGQEGIATLGMFVDDSDRSLVHKGTEIFLCDGPTVTVARAVVISDEISTKTLP